MLIKTTGSRSRLLILDFRWVRDRHGTSDISGLGGRQSDTMSPVKILNQIRGGMSSLCIRGSLHGASASAPSFWRPPLWRRHLPLHGRRFWWAAEGLLPPFLGPFATWQTANNVCATFTSRVAVLTSQKALPFAVCDILIAFAETQWAIYLWGGNGKKWAHKIVAHLNTLNAGSPQSCTK